MEQISYQRNQANITDAVKFLRVSGGAMAQQVNLETLNRMDDNKKDVFVQEVKRQVGEMCLQSICRRSNTARI